MAPPVVLHDPNGKTLHTEEYTIYGANERVLSTTTSQREHGVFNNVALTTNGTYVKIATPFGDGTIEVTDLIISGDEKAGGSVVVRFNDGTNTAIVHTIYVASRAATASVNPVGKIQGWKAAYLEAAVVGDNFSANVTAVYIKHIKTGKIYSRWNCER